MLQQNKIQLHNKSRTFTTLSSLPDEDVREGNFSSVIFLLHGFPDENTSYNGVWPHLVNAFPKALILAPLMRGYEKSSQSDNFREYSVKDLGSDVGAWITEVVPPSKRGKVPVHLVGHDWGAIAVFRASADYPDLITSAVGIAIPYLSNIRPYEMLWYVPEQIYNSSYMLTMQFASIYKPSISNVEGTDSYLDKLWKYWSPTWKYSPSDIENLKAIVQNPGVIDSITAYYRCLFNPFNRLHLKWKVDFNKVPTLLLGGATDGCMSKKLYEIEMNKLKDTPNVKVQLMSKVGHFLHREDPEKAGEAIIDWINKNS